MDIETLTNHISKSGKGDFETACKIVLQDVFNLNAINVDGKGDGGTDYTVFTIQGERLNACYQITTQKSNIKNKAYKDAQKSIKKLGVSKFFFLTSCVLSETESRKLEQDISTDLNIQATCLSSRTIAGLLINEKLVNKFFDETDYPLLKSNNNSFDYRERALHSYTLFSDDANKLKFGIYDDTITFILSEKNSLDENELIHKVIVFLNLSDKEDTVKRRIDSLYSKSIIIKKEGKIELNIDSKNDLKNRKMLYERELSSLSSAQVDIFRNEFCIDWNEEDSKKVTIWIANAFIMKQISILKEAKASIVSNPLFTIEDNGISKLKKFLLKNKKIKNEKVDEVIEKLLDNASNHPLITKLSRASVYLALDGSNPISSAKALGANRWSDFNVLIEPTVAIPYMCSRLYHGKVNRSFNNSIRAIEQAEKIGANLHIPYFYISECAGHLLKARRYSDIKVDENELQFSNNAFVANYYALKLNGIKVPNSFIDYLCSFSSALRTERADIKAWIRAIMIDVQSILTQGGVNFIDLPFYEEADNVEFEKEYMHYLGELNIDKNSNLINHDIYALQFTNDEIVKQNNHWIILTYDKSMISISKGDLYKGWITTPQKFIDLTELSKPLSEIQFVSLVHSVATFSEKTLSIGARIIDKVVQYASKDMQNWEFKEEIDKFKKELIASIDIYSSDFETEVDEKTDTFLKKHGFKQAEDEIDTDI
ncbi:hypothetical protein Barb4_03521 [Bacteroidales bacterium Barb4]|nr:hypothetical protein Barb4_03521 [Bacteroidales bacterium Barb4]